MRSKLIYLFGGFLIFLTIVISLNMLGDLVKKADEKEGEVAEEELIGGQKDEHGCLVAAGYSWCEEKEKCLRLWEEGCNRMTTILAELNDGTSETFSSLTEINFDWRGGESGEQLKEISGFSKTAFAVISDMDYEIDRFFKTSGFVVDRYNLLDKTLTAKGYQKEDVVCLVSSKKTDKDNPLATGKRNPYDFIVKCGELGE